MPLDRPEFTLVFSRTLGKVAVHVRGILDARTAPVLRHRLADLVLAQGNLSIVVDLGDVPLIETRGVEVLVEAHTWLEAKGGSLELTGARPDRARQLRATGLGTCLADVDLWARPAQGSHRGGTTRY